MKKILYSGFILVLVCTLILTSCGILGENQTHTHSFNEWISIKNASCTEDGVNERYCACGERQTQTVPAFGHQYNSGEIIVQATDNQNGLKLFTCTVNGCNNSYTESYTDLTYTATELYNRSMKYVCEITTYDKSGSAISLGTGFVISSNGNIVTNYHVIENAYSADAVINNKKYKISSVLAYDKNIDLVILKVDATGLTAATKCNQTISVGETVYAIGSSRGMTGTYSQGIVTYTNRIIDGVSYVQHDASIANGNSGGPLINAFGDVIGINTWTISNSQNLNFAISISELDKLVYKTPISLAQLNGWNEKETFNNEEAFNKLIDYIVANGEYNSESKVVTLIFKDKYDTDGSHKVFSLSYHVEDEEIYLWFDHFGDIDDFLTGIMLEKNVDDYNCMFSIYPRGDDTASTRIFGTIDYKTFTMDSSIDYYSYEGDPLMESRAADYLNVSVDYTLATFNVFSIENLDMPISALGFEAF